MTIGSSRAVVLRCSAVLLVAGALALGCASPPSTSRSSQASANDAGDPQDGGAVDGGLLGPIPAPDADGALDLAGPSGAAAAGGAPSDPEAGAGGADGAAGSAGEDADGPGDAGGPGACVLGASLLGDCVVE